MEIRLTLALPRDELSIPVVRRICTQSLTVLGVAQECQQDLELALAEACTNVLNHAGPGDHYEVAAGITDAKCVIEVIDAGHGFDSASLGHGGAGPTAEQGRGIQLMRALMDRVTFSSRPEKGTIVHLEKELHWVEAAPAKRLAVDGPPQEGPDRAASMAGTRIGPEEIDLRGEAEPQAATGVGAGSDHPGGADLAGNASQ